MSQRRLAREYPSHLDGILLISPLRKLRNSAKNETQRRAAQNGCSLAGSPSSTRDGGELRGARKLRNLRKLNCAICAIPPETKNNSEDAKPSQAKERKKGCDIGRRFTDGDPMRALTSAKVWAEVWASTHQERRARDWRGLEGYMWRRDSPPQSVLSHSE